MRPCIWHKAKSKHSQQQQQQHSQKPENAPGAILPFKSLVWFLLLLLRLSPAFLIAQ
jgi:hypothetical protein